MRLPAVVTVDLRIIGKKAVRNEALAGADAEWDETPRYASLKGIMAAKKKAIKDVTLAELGVDAAPTMKVTAYEAPPRAQGGRQGRLGRGAGREAPQRSEGDLMGAVLVFCEADDKGVRSASLPALTAGARAGQAGGRRRWSPS